MRIAMVIVDRANWGRLAPLAKALSPVCDLQLICAGSSVLSRFKCPADDIAAAGYNVAARLYHAVEGSTPETMARGVGLGVIEFVSAFERIGPDIVLIIGDRSEALAAAIAAAYSNRCIVHLQGGELSGSIDESARHAITKLAHYHVPATQAAADRIVRMGEGRDKILTIGCPSSDDRSNVFGGTHILVAYHPTTTHAESAATEVGEVLWAVRDAGRKAVVMWPNIDAGSTAVAKAMRAWRDDVPNTFTWITNVAPSEYADLISSAACCVGNSSSFVRDAGFYGTPVVLVGDRQEGREHGDNVRWMPAVFNGIAEAIVAQITHGRYAPNRLYGDGHVCERLVPRLLSLIPYAQKVFHD